MKTLTHDQARRLYNRIGIRQDSQAFYEDRATDELIPLMALSRARSVFEFGCGTGRFAEQLLDGHMSPEAVYVAIDLSPIMVDLARRRLARFAPRVEIRLTDGGLPINERTGAYDRFVSNFVLDLLPPGDITGILNEAHRMLRPGGLVGLCSLTVGFTPLTRAVSRLLTTIHHLRPALVGGCRGIELLEFLPRRQWRIRHHSQTSSFAIPLETVVAERL